MQPFVERVWCRQRLWYGQRLKVDIGSSLCPSRCLARTFWVTADLCGFQGGNLKAGGALRYGERREVDGLLAKQRRKVWPGGEVAYGLLRSSMFVRFYDMCAAIS